MSNKDLRVIGEVTRSGPEDEEEGPDESADPDELPGEGACLEELPP